MAFKLGQYIIIAFVVLLGASACQNKPKAKNKSFVGLESELDQSILNGQAPSFLLLQNWFTGALPVSAENSRTGGTTYQVHSQLNDQSMAKLPEQYRKMLTEYLIQQGQRIHDFQSNLQRPNELKALLQKEALELQDILMALIDVGYVPVTDDLLAHLIAHRPLRNFIDRYSVELLEKLFKRSLRSLIQGLPTETENFGNLLIAASVDGHGATPKFVASLGADCGKINRMLRSMNAKDTVTCRATGAMNLESGSVADNLESLGGSAGKTFGIVGGLTGPNSYADSANSVKLSIFQGRDVNTGDPTSNAPGGGGTTTGGTTTGGSTTGGSTTGSADPLASSFSDLNKLFESFVSGLGGASLTSVPPRALPRRPTGNACDGKVGMKLVVCQRYFQTLPSSSEMFKRSTNHKTAKLADSSELNLTGGYNFFMVGKYGTKIQNQGSEGACTAFGLAHTIGTMALMRGKSGEYDAWKIWSAQGQQPYLESALEAAKNMDFDGLKIESPTDVPTNIAAIKAQLDAGRPLYIGSDVDDSWNGAGDGKITCNGNSVGGHAYSLVGYDDASKKIIVKNSWGDSWGDQGYGYLDYDCLNNMGQVSLYDVKLK